MQIKITEPGWAGYTGEFGTVQFENGVSVDVVSRADAANLAGLIRIETLEGENPSHAQRIIDGLKLQAGVETKPTADKIPVVEVKAPSYTRDELAAVADAEGIKGLRVIADPLGLKANSVADLIAKIVEHAESKKAAAAAADAPKE